ANGATSPNYDLVIGTDPAPTVTALVPAAGATITGGSVNVDVTFSEAVVGVDYTDLEISGPATTGSFGRDAATNLGGNTWRFPLSGLANGALNISLAPDAGDIRDATGNDLGPRPTIWSYSVVQGTFSNAGAITLDDW